MRKRLVLAAAFVAALAACGESPVATERAQVPAATRQLVPTDTTTNFLNHDTAGDQKMVADSTATDSRGGGFMGGGH